MVGTLSSSAGGSDLIPGLREGDGTHSRTLAWKIPWAKEPGRL